jgi:MFS family permease
LVLGTYAKPENRTEPLTLVRLAVNLGFTAGPALGGLIIMNLGYSGLFLLPCIISILILHCLLKERKTSRFEYGEPRNRDTSLRFQG